MDAKDLRTYAAKAPDMPGVYIFKSGDGAPLYVGKASSLKKRLSGHLKPADAKASVMLSEAATVEFEVMDTEVEALLREADLIKRLRPKYNIELKDDKSFPVVAITNEPFPAVLITRDRTLNARFYGPFPEVKELRRAIDALQKVFLFRNCTFTIETDVEKRRRRRPCLLYHIRRCSAPCAGYLTEEEYARQIRDFKSFLAGGRRTVIASFKRRMHQAAKDRNFEEAARLRNQITALARIKDVLEGADETTIIRYEPEEALEELMRITGLTSPPRLIEGVDVATLQGADAVGAVVTFIDGEPFKEGYRRYRIKYTRPKNDPAMIAEIVYRRFARKRREDAPVPNLLLIDGGAGQLSAAKRALIRAQLAPDILCALAKKNEELLIEGESEVIRLERTSPALKLLQFVRDEAHRFAQHYHKLLRRKRTFGKRR